MEEAIKAIEDDHADTFVSASLRKIDDLILCSGPFDLVTRLSRLKPKEKARQCFSRIGAAGHSATRIAAIPLAMAAYFHNLQDKAGRTPLWRYIAVGKAAHRLSRPGLHRISEMVDDRGITVSKTVFHFQSRASKLMLVTVGEALSVEADWIIDKLASVVAERVARPSVQRA